MKNRIPSLFVALALAAVGGLAMLTARTAVAQGSTQMNNLSVQQGEKGESEENERAEGGGKYQLPQSYSSKISPWAAMMAAQKKVGGKPFQALYEFEDGKWNYGVAILKGKKIIEVDVNPVTGKVGSTENVTPSDEAEEMRDAFERVLKSAGG